MKSCNRLTTYDDSFEDLFVTFIVEWLSKDAANNGDVVVVIIVEIFTARCVEELFLFNDDQQRDDDERISVDSKLRMAVDRTEISRAFEEQTR